jgi:translation elongation factor EF-Tu-like GTPase
MPITAKHCPNCGAPLKLNGDGACVFCLARLDVTTPEGKPDHDAIAQAVDPNAPFAMKVDDVFAIRGRGTVVTGRVGAGTVRVGDAIAIVRAGETKRTRCIGIEMFRKTLEVAVAGETVGLILEGVDKKDVARGDWLRAP